MRNFVTIGFLLFCLGAGLSIGYKLSPDQLGVLVAVVIGVMAGIPGSVLMAVVLRRRQVPESMPTAQPQPGPPIIIVGPGGALPSPSSGGGETWPIVDQTLSDRDIRVIGDQ